MAIKNNTSFLEAGAIYAQNSDDIEISNVTFKFNSAYKNGGQL